MPDLGVRFLVCTETIKNITTNSNIKTICPPYPYNSKALPACNCNVRLIDYLLKRATKHAVNILPIKETNRAGIRNY